jgi:hypothetical protein
MHCLPQGHLSDILKLLPWVNPKFNIHVRSANKVEESTIPESDIIVLILHLLFG